MLLTTEESLVNTMIPTCVYIPSSLFNNAPQCLYEEFQKPLHENGFRYEGRPDSVYLLFKASCTGAPGEPHRNYTWTTPSAFTVGNPKS